MTRLPNCDQLFMKFFDRWYSDYERKRKGFRATRPDMIQESNLIGCHWADLSPLDASSQSKVLRKIDTMLNAATEDWKQYLNVRKPVGINWISAFDEFYDSRRAKAAIEKSDPAEFSNDYVVLCCEFGAVLGHVLCKLNSKLEWIPERPYWESALFHPNSGNIVPVFHWAIKKMSSYGIDDGFEGKIHCCLHVLETEGKRS